MNAFFQKISFLVFLSGLFVSCNAIKITNPSKQMVRPGLPTETAKISYSFSIAASEEIKINSISLLRKGNSTAITNYALINLVDGKILRPEAALIPGNYNVSFKIEAANININEAESIEITYAASGKKKTTVIIPELKSALLMK